MLTPAGARALPVTVGDGTVTIEVPEVDPYALLIVDRATAEAPR
jgi:hypothetical protein